MFVDIMPKLAVLIDADNAQPSLINRLLSENIEIWYSACEACLWRLD